MTGDCFSEAEFRAFFLDLLEQDGSNEEKYRRLVAFCRKQGQGEGSELAAPVTASVIPAELVDRTTESLRRALLRIRTSRHADGGWGKEVERSSLWQTAHAVLFLHAAQDLPSLSWTGELDEMLQGGVGWIERNHEHWSVDTLALSTGISTYNVGLLVRCFFRLGRTFFLRHETMQRAYRSLDRLYRAQNADGGWDAHVWSLAITTPTRLWSEVGATGAALMALAEARDERFRGVISRGAQWLAASQSPEGSWNDGSCHPLLPGCQLTGQPSVAKTADAVQGLLGAERAGVSLAAFPGCLDQALGWLNRQEKRILQPGDQGAVWAQAFSAAEYENATVTLETLLQLPDPQRHTALPSLVGIAAWLVGVQRKQDGDLDDGSWVLGDTARIGLALANFYRRITESESSERMPWVL